MFKDYYSILEISPLASTDDIKSAYKKQAIKWHPDKNPGVDTTQRMQDINEARLILSDEDARFRYDREYSKYNLFKESNKKTEQKGSTEQSKSGEKGEKAGAYYTTYSFDDEQLKKWMENARRQAARNVYEMVAEFRDSSYVGFSFFFKTALIAIAIGVIFFIIVSILKSI